MFSLETIMSSNHPILQIGKLRPWEIQVFLASKQMFTGSFSFIGFILANYMEGDGSEQELIKLVNIWEVIGIKKRSPDLY